jgi:hypothetical protein
MNNDMIYEITSYLSNIDFLNTRYVWRNIPNDHVRGLSLYITHCIKNKNITNGLLLNYIKFKEVDDLFKSCQKPCHVIHTKKYSVRFYNDISKIKCDDVLHFRDNNDYKYFVVESVEMSYNIRNSIYDNKVTRNMSVYNKYRFTTNTSYLTLNILIPLDDSQPIILYKDQYSYITNERVISDDNDTFNNWDNN